MSRFGAIFAGTVMVGAFSLACAAGASFGLRAASHAGELARFGIIAGSVFAAAVLSGVPLIMLGARSLRRLSGHLEQAAAEGAAETFRPAGLMGVLTSPGQAACRAWSERCDKLNSRLREMEIRLSVSEAERRHIEAILHSLQDAVIVTDAFNEVSLANEPAARLLGFDAEAANHKSVDSVLSDDTLRKLIKEVRQAGVLSKQKHFEHQLPGPDAHRGAKPGAFDVTLACLPDGRDGVGGVVTILRDVTKEKEISEMKSDFVSQASHELRTPLSSINAYIEMLIDAEAQDEPTRQEFYQIIKSEADRVTRMVDNMLNISRIEAGIISVDRSEVDFAKVLGEVMETMQPQAAAKSIMLIKKVGPLMYTAQADHDMMHQVIMNLVSNAIKYTPEGGRVTVTVENDDASRSVLVSVSDTGLGIPPDALKRLFEKFFRVENYKRMAKGTGLGLNLVKHIVETVHGGAVHVESEVGSGSRFWFTIPYEYQGG